MDKAVKKDMMTKDMMTKDSCPRKAEAHILLRNQRPSTSVLAMSQRRGKG